MQSNLTFFFKRAVYLSDKNLPLSAIADAKFAYSLSIYQYDNYRIVRLVVFLAQIYFDNGFMKEAESYCKLGHKMLD
jgi:hypothetical protein